jgi:hypothetical protein
MCSAMAMSSLCVSLTERVAHAAGSRRYSALTACRCSNPAISEKGSYSDMRYSQNSSLGTSSSSSPPLAAWGKAGGGADAAETEGPARGEGGGSLPRPSTSIGVAAPPTALCAR